MKNCKNNAHDILGNENEICQLCNRETQMTNTETLIEEALARLRVKVRKLVKENVNYLISDKDDPRVGILAQEQMEDWMVQFLKQELTAIATKSAEESLKNWYFEGDELVITKGKWVIDRYKRNDL